MTTTQKEMKRLAKKYTQVNAKIKALEDEKKELATAMKALMDGQEAIQVDEYTIRNKCIVSSRFDTKALQANCPDIYKLYLKASNSTRFTVDYTAPVTEV